MTQRSHRLGVALAGAGHSGSTLLGLVLGSHSRCFYAGEAKKSRFLGDRAKPLRKRACKLCGEACPIWSRFRPDPDLFEALARLSGRGAIVDSTKDVSWIRARRAELAAAGVPHKLVFLARDGRAVVNSRLRKDPSRDPAAVTDAWAAQVRATSALVAELGEDALAVRYETKPHHPLGGNTGTQSLIARSHGEDRGVPDRSRAFYEPLRGGFRLDLRWREELPAQALAVFEERAGDLNEPFRWEGEP